MTKQEDPGTEARAGSATPLELTRANLGDLKPEAVSYREIHR